MAAIPLAYLVAGSAAMSAVSAISSSRQQSAAAQSEANMAEYNAQMADIQAKQTYAMAGEQEDLQRKRARAAMGTSLAASAEAGGGLNSDSLRQSLYDAETDALAIRYDGALKANGYTSTAGLQRSSAVVSRDRASRAKTAGYLNAAGSVLNAGTSYYAATSKLNAKA